MYYIDSKVDKPDSEYLRLETVKQMEKGVRVADVERVLVSLENEIEAYAKDIEAEYGVRNPNSPSQVVAYLRSLNSMDVVEACFIDGKWTTNGNALQKVADSGYEFAELMLKYRKLKSCEKAISSLIKAKDTNGLIHPTISLAKTNRVLYSNPPLMSVPKAMLWGLIKPHGNGNVLVSADIKNQEPNILINMNNIDSLKYALTAPEGLYEALFQKIPVYCDVNIIVDNSFKPGIIQNKALSEMENVPPVYYTPKKLGYEYIKVNGSTVKMVDVVNVATPIGTLPELPNKVMVLLRNGEQCYVDIEVKEKITQKQVSKLGILNLRAEITGVEKVCGEIERREFKTAWIGMGYGLGIQNLKENCKHINAKEVYEFYNNIPELKRYRESCNKKAHSFEQNTETYFGTVLTANEMNKSQLKRTLLDLPIQGTAADLLSMLERHFNETMEQLGYKDKIWIYYSRNDELILEVDKETWEELGDEEVLKLIKDTLDSQIDDWVPMTVEVDKIKEMTRTELLRTALGMEVGGDRA